MYEAVVIGASAGGLKAIRAILSGLPRNFPLSITIVQHMASHSDSFMAEYLAEHCPLPVKEAEDKEAMKRGTVYVAPADYHLQVEPGRTFSLSVDPPVNFSCPAIDVLFETAAEVYAKRLIGIVLTGASADGSAGLKRIKEKGGIAIVQNPVSAEYPFMPQSAVAIAAPHYVTALDHIAALLLRVTDNN